jgi:ATP-binding cassette subfamily B protein
VTIGAGPTPESAGVTDGLLWPTARRDEAAEALARAAGIARPAAPEWFRLTHGDLAARAGGSAAAAAAAVLGAQAPAFFWVEGGADGPSGWLAVVEARGATARVLGPAGALAQVPADAVARLLRRAAEARASAGIGDVVARAGIAPSRAAAVHDALVGAALADEFRAEGWRVRRRSASLGEALREAGVARRLALAGIAYGAELALLVAAWWMVGARGAAGQAGPGPGHLPSWLGVLAAFVAARAAASWAAGRLALDGGRLLRARLMNGLLALDTEPLRAEGIGQLLGRVMETEAVESLALGGGLTALAGLFELATGTIVLALGTRASSELALLALALTLGAALAARLWRALARWSAMRLGLTHDLVERMVGHRTLVAQQPPELRHRGEDEALAAYEAAGRALDRASAALVALVPRGFLLAGVAALAPALVAADVAPGLVAATLGGVLFVHGALRKLALAFSPLATAAVAWRQVAPLFAAADADAATPAASPASAGAAALEAAALEAAALEGAAPGAPLLVARDVGFRYPDRAAPAVAGCTFEIRRGDRILLEGPSGGGKSTLASLIAGLRAPDAGTLTFGAADQSELGLPRWRERVGVVPQFHENHVFTASMLFNLLLGRAWPPRREDAALAETLCRELDLGGLLARMPSGLEQIVGESGWQLSHGERSRLFIARALLQRLDLRVLDESFAALDPETLERVLDCVLLRAETLLVIAHP